MEEDGSERRVWSATRERERLGELELTAGKGISERRVWSATGERELGILGHGHEEIQKDAFGVPPGDRERDLEFLVFGTWTWGDMEEGFRKTRQGEPHNKQGKRAVKNLGVGFGDNGEAMEISERRVKESHQRKRVGKY